MTALEAQFLLARVMLLALLYTFIGAVALMAWRDVRAATCWRPARGAGQAMARLIVIDPGASDRPAGSAFSLSSVTAIGRDLDNEIVLSDPTVSGRHAVISRRGGAWWVEDLGSTNGTLLNAHRMLPATPMLARSGDVLQLGAVRFRLAADDEG